MDDILNVGPRAPAYRCVDLVTHKTSCVLSQIQEKNWKLIMTSSYNVVQSHNSIITSTYKRLTRLKSLTGLLWMGSLAWLQIFWWLRILLWYDSHTLRGGEAQRPVFCSHNTRVYWLCGLCVCVSYSHMRWWKNRRWKIKREEPPNRTFDDISTVFLYTHALVPLCLTIWGSSNTLLSFVCHFP
jgi:hypothetical protein